MIYVSTGGMSTIKGLDACHLLEKAGITGIELSGGKHDKGQVEKVIDLDSRLNLAIHNYFPPPKDPFVFNLAAEDATVRRRSISHAKNAIEIASKLKTKIYSMHAGFLINLKACELGSHIKNRRLSDRDEGMERFINQVIELAEFAKCRGVRLLVENNVLAGKVYNEFNSNPLLMTNIKECLEVMQRLEGKVGLLVDVGHLNVSAETLGFDKYRFLEECSAYIEGYHLSENDGKWDSNKAVIEDSWFWDYLRKDLSYYSLEVYNCPADILARQVRCAQEMLYR